MHKLIRGELFVWVDTWTEKRRDWDGQEKRKHGRKKSRVEVKGWVCLWASIPVTLGPASNHCHLYYHLSKVYPWLFSCINIWEPANIGVGGGEGETRDLRMWNEKWKEQNSVKMGDPLLWIWSPMYWEKASSDLYPSPLRKNTKKTQPWCHLLLVINIRKLQIRCHNPNPSNFGELQHTKHLDSFSNSNHAKIHSLT